MRSIIAVIIVVAVAAVIPARSVSMSNPGAASRAQVTFGGGSAVPTHTVLLW
jgi:hypothetical protein